MLDPNKNIYQCSDSELMDATIKGLQKAIISYNQHVQNEDFVKQWALSFIYFIKQKHKGNVLGSIKNFFEQLSSGTIEMDKISGRNIIRFYDLANRKGTSGMYYNINVLVESSSQLFGQDVKKGDLIAWETDTHIMIDKKNSNSILIKK